MTFDQFARRLRGARFSGRRSIAVLRSVPSSNDLGKQLLRDHLRDGRAMPACDLVAWEQTAGRGRGDHRWSSPPGAGVWASLLRPLQHASALQTLPLAVGVGIVEALRPSLGDGCRLAWPNDVVVGERKIAGILVEGVTVGDLGGAVIGFGVNHVADLIRRSAPAATSVCDAARGDPPDLTALAINLLAAVDDACARDRPAVLEAYRLFSVHRPGDALRCRAGGEEVAGELIDFDQHGFLLLDTDDGVRRVAAGEVAIDER